MLKPIHGEQQTQNKLLRWVYVELSVSQFRWCLCLCVCVHMYCIPCFHSDSPYIICNASYLLPMLLLLIIRLAGLLMSTMHTLADRTWYSNIWVCVCMREYATNSIPLALALISLASQRCVTFMIPFNFIFQIDIVNARIETRSPWNTPRKYSFQKNVYKIKWEANDDNNGKWIAY